MIAVIDCNAIFSTGLHSSCQDITTIYGQYQGNCSNRYIEIDELTYSREYVQPLESKRTNGKTNKAKAKVGYI